MAGPKRNPLDLGLGEDSFVQRFVLAEILGPPKARSRTPVAPPRAAACGSGEDPRPAGESPRSRSG